MTSRARLGALFPIVHTKGTLDQSGMLRLGAFLLAIDEINNSSELLPSIQLDFVLRDSRRDGLSALVGALELVGSCGSSEGSSGGIVAAIGAASSGPSESAAAAFSKAKVPQISYSSTSPKLSDGSKSGFPWFLRTPPSDAFQAEAMVDILSNLFNFSHVATVKSTDSYGMEGLAAFSALWTAQNRTILTSQSISSDDVDFSLVYSELRRVRARVIVLFCQAKEGGRFLRGAYRAGVGGAGFLVFGSDAVTSPGTWLGDDAEGGLASDMALRDDVLRGYFGLTPSNGQGTPRYSAYRERLVKHSAAALPRLSTVVRTASDAAAPCDVAATLATSPAWNATDADGRLLWIQGSGSSAVCAGPSDPLEDNSYAPYAYDAVYAVAHALHALTQGGPLTAAVSGDALMDALLGHVSFDGVTGRVEFSSGERPATGGRRGLQSSADVNTLYRGDRRVGISYAVQNFQDGALVRVGSWTACGGSGGSTSGDGPGGRCAAFTPEPGTTLRFSTADNARPADVDLQFCALQKYARVVGGCEPARQSGFGERLVVFDTPFGCEPRPPLELPSMCLAHPRGTCSCLTPPSRWHACSSSTYWRSSSDGGRRRPSSARSRSLGPSVSWVAFSSTRRCSCSPVHPRLNSARCGPYGRPLHSLSFSHQWR